VSLDLLLAGLGSRFIATIVDVVIQLVLFIALYLVFTATTSNGFLLAVFSIAAFLVLFGYDVLFEVANVGRTPGKLAAGLRVVRRDGRPVDFVTSAIRNLLRVVDFLPSFYVVGAVMIVATHDHQRLGDIAASTIVVRERRAKTQAVPLPPPAPTPDAAYVSWDVSAVTPDELATVRSFLERRTTITPAARAQLAWELSARLRAKVGGPHEQWPPEPFLEAVVAAKSARG
jgi:uncharacterized RDD family membrane protein YckC